MMEKSLIVHADGSATLSKDRLRLCLEVAFEMEALGFVLPSLTTCGDVESLSAGFMVRGLAGRFVELGGALMAALDDAAVPLNSLSAKVLVTPLEVGGE